MSYAFTGYSIGSYSGGPTFGVLYLSGASVVAAPAGFSNLPAPTAVGRYGSFSWSTAANESVSKALPVRFGKSVGWVSISNIQRPISLASLVGVGPLLPAYGN